MTHIVATSMGEFLETDTVMPNHDGDESPTIFLAQQIALSRTGRLHLARSTIPTLNQSQRHIPRRPQAQPNPSSATSHPAPQPAAQQPPQQPPQQLAQQAAQYYAQQPLYTQGDSQPYLQTNQQTNQQTYQQTFQQTHQPSYQQEYPQIHHDTAQQTLFASPEAHSTQLSSQLPHIPTLGQPIQHINPYDAQPTGQVIPKPTSAPFSFDAANDSVAATRPKAKSDKLSNIIATVLLIVGLLGIFAAIPFNKIGQKLATKWAAVSESCCTLDRIRAVIDAPKAAPQPIQTSPTPPNVSTPPNAVAGVALVNTANAANLTTGVSATAPAAVAASVVVSTPDAKLIPNPNPNANANANPSLSLNRANSSVAPSNTPASQALLKLCEQLIQAQPKVRFITRSSTLSNASKAAIDDVLICLQSHRVTLLGHTDGTGTADRKERVGLERAEAVKAYLVDLGLKPDTISVQSAADSQPLANNNTSENRAKNRRIEIKLTPL